jgi:hypothetical protein
MALKVMKACRRCREVKPLETGFHRKTASKDGHTHLCTACRNADCAVWRAENPGYHKIWQSENVDYLRQSQRASRERRAQEKEAARVEAQRKAEEIHQQRMKDSMGKPPPRLLCDYRNDMLFIPEEIREAV